jgi:hypothetical protein
LNLPVQTTDLADYERFIAGARAAMDAQAFEAAWVEGQGLTLEQASELALAEDATSAPDATTPTGAR